jgi:bifunctional ADP-heptose synthase (sugar kinase/adenylyltransferase)
MPKFETKICSRAELQARVAALPKPVVLTNGVFDILHRGHVTYLAQARDIVHDFGSGGMPRWLVDPGW